MRLIDDAGILGQQPVQQQPQIVQQPRLQLEDDAGIMVRKTITPADVARGAYIEMGGGTDIRAKKFIPQFTKSLYDNLPFGKRVINSGFNARSTQPVIETTPEPKGVGGWAGSLTGLAAAYTPAYMAGEGLVQGATAKLAAGSAGVGIQDAGKAKSLGATNIEALGQGTLSAGANFVGGKVLGAAGKAISDIPKNLRGVSGRISDWIVKLPKNSFSYSKDPLAVFSKENIVANTIGDYSKKAGELLEQRVAELNQAVSSNPKFIDISNMFSGKIQAARNLAKSSLKDRKELMGAIDDFQSGVAKQYGDLRKLSVPDAVRLKRQISDDFPFSALESKSSTNNLLSKIGHEVHHNINEAIEKVAPEITELNQRVSGLIDIKDAARNRMIVESRQNPIGLIGTLLGMGAAGGVYGQATGQNPIETGIKTALITKAVSSPFVLTRVAKALSRMADVDKINVLKAFPFLQRAGNKDIEKQVQPILARLGYEPAPPKYLQERANAPIQSMGVEAPMPDLRNPVAMGSVEQAPKALPAPEVLPQYLKDRQNVPSLESLAAREPGTMGNPVSLPRPEPTKEGIQQLQAGLREAKLNKNEKLVKVYESKLKNIGVQPSEKGLPVYKTNTPEKTTMEQLIVGKKLAESKGNLEAAARYDARIKELDSGANVKSLNDLLKQENEKSGIVKKLLSNKGFATTGKTNSLIIPTKTYNDMGDTASHWISKNGKLIQGGSEEGHMAVWENNLKELGFTEREALKLINKSETGDFEKNILSAAMEKGNIRVNIGKNKEMNLEVGKLNKETTEKLKKVLENNQNYVKINIDVAGKPVAEGNAKQVLAKLNSLSNENVFSSPKIPEVASKETTDLVSHWVSPEGKLLNGEGNDLGHIGLLEENPTWFGLSKDYKFVGSPSADLNDVHNAIKNGYIRLTVSGYKNLNIQVDKADPEVLKSIRNMLEVNNKYKMINVEDINSRQIAEGNIKQVLSQLNGKINKAKVEPKSAAQWHLEGDMPFGVLGPTMAAGSAISLGALAGNISKAEAATKTPEMTDENAIKTIIGEAENQGKDGMRAVASTIRNRKTLRGAYGINALRVVNKKYSKATYEQAKQAWEESKSKDFSGGSNHWFSDADLKQDNVKRMIRKMKMVKRVGTQSFYVE